MWGRSKNKISFFSQNIACSSLCSQLILLSQYASTRISFPSSVARWGCCREVYSCVGLGDCSSPVTRRFWIRGSRLYLAGTQKSVSPCNPNYGQEILCYVQEGLSSVLLRVQLNVSLHLELAATQKMLTGVTKPRSLPIAGLYSNGHFDYFFVYFIRT
jgi:hypothetical protein